jgi:hypothetical protein
MQRVKEAIMKRKLACAIGLFVLGNMWVMQGMAHSLTLDECTEGGEFIRNAALARDNGVSREFFVGKLVEDLMMIQSYPAPMRWFVQDPSDEKFLSDAVYRVFDEPMKAEQHEASFVGACLLTVGTDGTRI